MGTSISVILAPPHGREHLADLGALGIECSWVRVAAPSGDCLLIDVRTEGRASADTPLGAGPPVANWTGDLTWAATIWLSRHVEGDVICCGVSDRVGYAGWLVARGGDLASEAHQEHGDVLEAAANWLAKRTGYPEDGMVDRLADLIWVADDDAVEHGTAGTSSKAYSQAELDAGMSGPSAEERELAELEAASADKPWWKFW